MRVEQFSILLRNEPGVLSNVLNELSNNNLNILGLTINETTNFGELRIVVDNAKKQAAQIKKQAHEEAGKVLKK